MFWNKNDINKDWEDYEKYRKEKETRDRELYGDYPEYRYDENEHHVHDEHCSIGASSDGSERHNPFEVQKEKRRITGNRQQNQPDYGNQSQPGVGQDNQPVYGNQNRTEAGQPIQQMIQKRLRYGQQGTYRQPPQGSGQYYKQAFNAASPLGSKQQKQVKTVILATVFIIILVNVFIVMGRVSNILSSNHNTESTSEQEEKLQYLGKSEIIGYEIQGVELKNDHVMAKIEVTEESTRDEIKVRFAFFDEDKNVLDQNICTLNTKRLPVGTVRTVTSKIMPKKTAIVLITIIDEE